MVLTHHLTCVLVVCGIKVEKDGHARTVEIRTSPLVKVHPVTQPRTAHDKVTLRISCTETGPAKPSSEDLHFDAFLDALDDSDIVSTIVIDNSILPRRCQLLLHQALFNAETRGNAPPSVTEYVLDRSTRRIHLTQEHCVIDDYTNDHTYPKPFPMNLRKPRTRRLLVLETLNVCTR